MEYGKAPTKCINPVADFIREQEAYFTTQHGAVKVRKATPDDIAKIEAELAAKSGVTVDILGDLHMYRKPERTEIPYEEMAVKSRLAERVNFERVAG